ncbi:MAG TPA: PKD-like domain-containing protein, partial [Saprospiraceae bacterium]|nr:PKD-like domain-containing protein [Saprospiraceae bacterium]
MDFIATFLLALLLQANVTNSTVGFETNPNTKIEACVSADDYKTVKYAMCINSDDDQNGLPFLNMVAPSITATKTALLVGTDNGPTGPSPGDVIEYTVVISNASGAMDATGVIFTDVIDANTTLVPGSLKTSVVAVNDAYSTVGNVSISVPAASGLLINDINLDGDVLNVTGINTAGTQGNVTFSPDGSFTFNPNPGYTGSTTFTYTVSDGTYNSVGTVTITMTGMIWFINAGAPAGGDGRLNSPWNTMNSFNASSLDDPGDNIFVYSGTYTNTLSTILLGNQRLIGQGAVGSLATLASVTFSSFPPISPATIPTVGGTNPIFNQAGNNVNAQSVNRIYGLTINNTSGTSLVSNGSTSLLIRDLIVTNTGGIAVNFNSSALDVIFRSVSASNGSYGMRVSNTTGSLEITGTGTTDGSGGVFNNIGSRGIELISASNITLRNLTMTNANTIETGFDGICDYDDNLLCNSAVYMNNVSTAVLNNVDISTTNEHGINGNVVSNLTLTNCTSTGNGDSEEENALKFRNLTGTCSFSGCTFSNAYYRNSHIINTSGSLILTINNCNFENTSYVVTRQDCFEMRTQSNATATVTITNSSFARAGSKGVQALAEDNSNFVFNFTSNTIRNFGNPMAGIEVGSNGANANMNYNINNNTEISSQGEVAVLASTFITSDLNGRVNDNGSILHNSPTATTFANIRNLHEGNGQAIIEIKNNPNVTSSNIDIPVDAIAINGNNSAARLDLTLLNNNITNSTTTVAGLEGIVLRAGTSTVGTAINTLCGNISNNTLTLPPLYPRAYRVRYLDPSSFMQFQGAGPTINANWTGNGNTNSNGAIAFGPTTTFTFGATCTVPSHPFTSGITEDALTTDDQGLGQELFVDTFEPNVENSSNSMANSEGTSSVINDTEPPVAMSMMSGETVTVGGMSGFLLPQDRNMTISFQVSIDNPFPLGDCSISNQGTISGSNFSTVLTDDPSVAGAANPTVTTLNIAPTITVCPPNLMVNPTNATCGSLQTFSATAVGCPTPTIVYRIGATVITSPYTFPTGTTTVDVTASNGVLPNATCSFTVTVAPPPTAFNVSGGGTRCDVDPGFVINLSDTETGVSYQLFNGMTTIGSPIAGTGMAIDFPAQSAAGTYTVVGVGPGGCSTTMLGSAVINVSITPISDAGMAQTICATSTATLAATATNGTGQWTIVSGPSLSLAQFSSTTSGSAVFTPSGGAGMYTLRWTVSNSPCTDATDDVIITVNPVPTADAGTPQTICENGSAILNATFTNGVGIWSVISGPSLSGTQFADNSDAATTFTPSGGMGTYTLRWVVTSSGCPDATDDVVITVNGLPSGDAGMNQAICGNASASLSASFVNGTPQWSVVSGPSLLSSQFSSTSSPTATFTPAGGAGTYILRWTVSNAPCIPFTDDVEIIASTPPTGNAGDDQSICSDQTATLNASFANGTGLWSVVSGPSVSSMQFSNVNAPNAVFTPAGGGGTYILRWTISAPGCTDVVDEVEISVLTSTTAIATPSAQTICTGEAITEIVLSSPVTGTTFTWTRDNTVSVTGIAASGTTNINGSLVNTTNSAVTVTFTISPTAGTCTGPDITATVVVNPIPNAVATPSGQTICSGEAITTIALTGDVAGTVYNWTRDNAAGVTGISASGSGDISGTLTNITNAPITVTFTIVPSYTNAGETCTGAPITATVIVNPTPNVVATPSSQTICTGSTITTIALTGDVVGTVFNWTRDNAMTVTGIAASGSGDISGTLTNTTNAAITVTFTITPSYTNSGETCLGTPITATVVVNPIPNAVATPSNQTICTGSTITTIALTGNVVGTVYNWTRDNAMTVTGIAASGSGDISGSLTNTTNAAITVIFTITPSYTNAGGTCTGTPITAAVVVNPIPNAVATPSSQTICTGSTITTIALTGNVAGTVYNWTRDNTVGVTGIAASGSGDISGSLTNTTNAAITVTFTITPSYTNAGGTCTGTPITATVVVNPIPNAVATPSNQTICTGSSITSIALTGNVAGTVYNWTRDNTVGVTGIAASGSGDISGSLTNTTNAAITVTFTITPSYTNAGGTCTGTPITATVVVNPIPNAVATPSAQTICTGSTITTIALTGNVVGTVYNWTRDNTVGVTGIAASGSGDISGSLTNTTNGSITVTFTITPSYTNAGGTCTGTPITATVVVNPIPNAVATPSAQTICTGSTITTIALTGNVVGTVYNWTRDNTVGVTGIAASGSGDISGSLTNTTNAAITVTFTITPSYTNAGGTCTGTPIIATVVVNPIPNAIATPNEQTICSEDEITNIVITGNVSGTVFSWTRDNTMDVTGISTNGTGDVSGSLTNITDMPITVTFTITPSYTNAGGTCTGTPIIATVVVNPTATVDQVANQTLCNGATSQAVTFTSSSTNGDIIYNWTNNAPSIGLAASGSGNISSFTTINTGNQPVVATITVIPEFSNGGVQCDGVPMIFTITVNPPPVMNAVTNVVVCNNAMTPTIDFTTPLSGGSIVYNWTNDNTSIGLGASGTGDILPFTAINTSNTPVVANLTVIMSYTNDGITCVSLPMNFTITVNPTPIVNAVQNQVVCNNLSTTLIQFGSPTTGGTITYNWTNNTPSIGLAAMGTGNIAAFIAINTSTTPVIATITVTPSITNGGITCTGNPITFTITVNPSPTVFTVSGGGTKCTTDDGLAITLSGSQTGVNYQLQLNGGNVGAPIAGTGAALNFPVQSTAGTYTVVATNATTGCTNNMTGNAVILVITCGATITDPCVCLNNATSPTNGQFSEMITVNAPAGQTWTVSAVSGLFTTTSPAPPAAPIAITVGTVLTASGGTYTLNGRHIDALGYTLSVTNNRGTTLTIGNSCSYPSPIISSPAAAVCLGTPYPLTGVPGDANIVSASFTVNGVAATTFNPTATGTYTIVYTVNGGIPKAFGPNDPGCIQSITQLVEVNPLPVITLQPVDTGVCDDGTAIFTVAATVAAPSTVSYQWQRQINGIWTNINGATTTTLTVSNVTDVDNNSRFRVIVSSENTNGVSCPVFSNVVWLYVHTSVSMTCNGHINYSLDENCGAENFASIFLSGPNSSFFYDVVFKLGNTVIPTSQVKNYIGRVLTYEVIDICDGNRCWGTVTFEDKLPPVLNCPCSTPPANVSTMTEIARTGTKIYYRSNGTYSWQAAYAHAQSIGGQMVSINNAQENALIKAGMDANYPAGWRVWIGLTDDEAYGGSEA